MCAGSPAGWQRRAWRCPSGRPRWSAAPRRRPPCTARPRPEVLGPRHDPGDELQHFEHLREQHQRGAHHGNRRHHGEERQARRRLHLHRHRRLLAAHGTRRPGQPRRRSRQISLRHEGPRRLPARARFQIRHLLLRRRQDLRRLPRQPGPRVSGRAPLSVVGRRLHQVRLVPHPHPRPAGGLHHHIRCPLRRQTPRRLQHLRMGRQQTLGVGQGCRAPLAHHRRHHRLPRLHAALGTRLEGHPRSPAHPRAAQRRPSNGLGQYGGPATGTPPTCSGSAAPALTGTDACAQPPE